MASSSEAKVNMSDYVVGRRVKLVLQSQKEVEGTIFAVDAEGHRIILEEQIVGADPALRDTRIVNVLSIVSKTFEKEEAASIDSLPALTKEQAMRREKAAFQARELALLPPSRTRDDSSRAPPGTRPEAQEIFDVLSKTFDCRWRGGNIEELKLGVTIKPPFRQENVTGKDSRAVQRVKDLLARIQVPK